MVEKKEGKIRVHVSLDRSVYERISALATEAGLGIDSFIALSMETMTVDPLLQVLADDPAQAREVAIKAVNEYLTGEPIAPAATEPGPPPQPDPVDEELKKVIGGLATMISALATQVGVPLLQEEQEERSGDHQPPPARPRRAKPSSSS